MFGLSQKNGPERQELDKLYDTLVRSADNERNKLYNDRLATAVHEIVLKADDPKFSSGFF